MIILKAIQNKELQEYTNNVYWHIGLLFFNYLKSRNTYSGSALGHKTCASFIFLLFVPNISCSDMQPISRFIFR